MQGGKPLFCGRKLITGSTHGNSAAAFCKLISVTRLSTSSGHCWVCADSWPNKILSGSPTHWHTRTHAHTLTHRATSLSALNLHNSYNVLIRLSPLTHINHSTLFHMSHQAHNLLPVAVCVCVHCSCPPSDRFWTTGPLLPPWLRVAK